MSCVLPNTLFQNSSIGKAPFFLFSKRWGGMKLKEVAYSSFTCHFVGPTMCKDKICPWDTGAALRENGRHWMQHARTTSGANRGRGQWMLPWPPGQRVPLQPPRPSPGQRAPPRQHVRLLSSHGHGDSWVSRAASHCKCRWGRGIAACQDKCRRGCGSMDNVGLRRWMPGARPPEAQPTGTRPAWDVARQGEGQQGRGSTATGGRGGWRNKIEKGTKGIRETFSCLSTMEKLFCQTRYKNGSASLRKLLVKLFAHLSSVNSCSNQSLGLVTAGNFLMQLLIGYWFRPKEGFLFWLCLIYWLSTKLGPVCNNSVGKFYPLTSNDNVGSTRASSSPSHAHSLKASASYVCFYFLLSNTGAPASSSSWYMQCQWHQPVCRSAAWQIQTASNWHLVTLRPKLWWKVKKTTTNGIFLKGQQSKSLMSRI